MAKKIFIGNIFRRRRKAAGFTLIELLVSVAIGWIVISALLYMIVQMLQTDRKEFALTQTQSEMDAALNYITTELQESIYVYEKDCMLGTAASGCTGLKFIPNTATQKPILAFWKQEQLPYVEDNPSDKQQLPTSCSGANASKCNILLLNRHSPTLVVYSLRIDADSTWKGPARLTRFELRAFDKDNLSTLTATDGYPKEKDGFPRNSQDVGFDKWPCDNSGGDCKNIAGEFNDVVLVDLVDTQKIKDDGDLCPSGYSVSKADETDSFYACIKPYSQGEGQDAIVHLRGNAIDRAGLRGWDSKSSFLPQVQAQVQTRARSENKPIDPTAQ